MIVNTITKQYTISSVSFTETGALDIKLNVTSSDGINAVNEYTIPIASVNAVLDSVPPSTNTLTIRQLIDQAIYGYLISSNIILGTIQ